jgi:hypothetical protein
VRIAVVKPDTIEGWFDTRIVRHMAGGVGLGRCSDLGPVPAIAKPKFGKSTLCSPTMMEDRGFVPGAERGWALLITVGFRTERRTASMQGHRAWWVAELAPGRLAERPAVAGLPDMATDVAAGAAAEVEPAEAEGSQFIQTARRGPSMAARVNASGLRFAHAPQALDGRSKPGRVA